MTIVQIRLPLVSTQQISKAAGYVAGQVRRAESRRRMQRCFFDATRLLLGSGPCPSEARLALNRIARQAHLHLHFHHLIRTFNHQHFLPRPADSSRIGTASLAENAGTDSSLGD
jgi:hypothetical protein